MLREHREAIEHPRRPCVGHRPQPRKSPTEIFREIVYHSTEVERFNGAEVKRIADEGDALEEVSAKRDAEDGLQMSLCPC